jgi:pyridoxal biosynthesis lyase PdxS
MMGARYAAGGLAATIVGAIGLALGATGVFVQLTRFGFRTGSVLKLAGARRTQSGTAKNLRPMKNNAKPLRPA